MSFQDSFTSSHGTVSFYENEILEQTYPDDIMLSTYAADGSNLYTSIDKVISPLTAYCIGLADTCPELALFPQLADVEPGVFRYGTGTQDSWLDSGAVAV